MEVTATLRPVDVGPGNCGPSSHLPTTPNSDSFSEATCSPSNSPIFSPSDVRSTSSTDLTQGEDEAGSAHAMAATSSGESESAAKPDAKSSALKALAGINRVVSRSRKVDAEALQAIKAQRAKAKADGTHQHRHSHSRTLSSESMPSMPDSAALSISLPRNLSNFSSLASSGGGSLPLPPSSPGATGGGSGAATPPLHGLPPPLAADVRLTSPRAYADWLSHRTLPELLALQNAVDHEITRQLYHSRLNVTGPCSTDSAVSAQYASALAAAQLHHHQQQSMHHPQQHSPQHRSPQQQQRHRHAARDLQQQQQHDQAAALQQALAAASSLACSEAMGSQLASLQAYGNNRPGSPLLLAGASGSLSPPGLGPSHAGIRALDEGQRFRPSHSSSLSLDTGLGEVLSRQAMGLEGPPEHLLGDLHSFLDAGLNAAGTGGGAPGPSCYNYQTHDLGSSHLGSPTALLSLPLGYATAASNSPPFTPPQQLESDVPSLFGALRLSDLASDEGLGGPDLPQGLLPGPTPRLWR